MSGEEFSVALRAALRRFILRTSTISAAANTLGVSRGTLHRFFAGETDPGFLKVHEWAEKLGLPPRDWILETKFFLDLSSYSTQLSEILESSRPSDPLTRTCATLADKLSLLRPVEAPALPPIAVQIEDIYLADPQAAAAYATKCLKNKIRQIKSVLRDQDEPTSVEIAEFFALVASYGVCRYLRTHPQECGHCIVIGLNHYQDIVTCPSLTWLLIDASMVSWRHLNPEMALFFARKATAYAVEQDTCRLYPRALLNLGSLLFHVGQYRASTEVYSLVLNTRHPNPYQPLAVYTQALTLAPRDPRRAKEMLERSSALLDRLPPHRQLQRHWVAARVHKELGSTEESFLSYSKAIAADEDACDPRDLFLIFDEIRELMGVDDKRLEPLACLLRRHLRRLSEMPQAFMIAKSYLDSLPRNDESQLEEAIKRLASL